MKLSDVIKSGAITVTCAVFGACCCEHPSFDHFCAFCAGVFAFKFGMEFSDWWYSRK